MDIIFFGSSDFSVESLKLLTRDYAVAAVVTQPDRRKGRHLHMSETPVKLFALEKGIPVLQPENVCAAAAIAELKKFKAGLFVVVSFGQKLSQEVLEIPELFCVNVHSSLLPRWRGAAPINHAIMNGDEITGVSIMKMNERMDCGDIILAKSIPIADDDAVALTRKLAELGAQALVEALRMIENGTARFTPQDEMYATVAKKLKKEDGLIDWQDTAENICNKVRGLVPWPCAYTYYKGKFLKILKAAIESDYAAASPGAVVSGQVIGIVKNKGIIVAAGNAAVSIEEVQLEGKRVTCAYDFVLGHRLSCGEKLG
ncbi:MAG: methionyl-tRNA formyltransferase [Candidatus Omnitrophica bacterium]|nr:methionyl-tRNA formyltransferase [Candidatus Omnitrophota bacterium]MCG2703987.1 methionyl-tRNA formyltransferase [Candidatus Omnitrophota bacterium]